MEEKIKNIEIEVSINHDLNEANFILAPKSAKNMNEIYAAHLEEKIGNQIKTYKQDVECALEIVRNSEAKIDNFEKIVDKSKENSSFAQEKVIELQNSLTSYAKRDLENLTPSGTAKFVKRAGDTMTGALTIQNNVVQKLSLASTELDSEGAAPAAAAENQIAFCDKNDKTYGTISGKFDTDNTIGVALTAKRTLDDEVHQAEVNVYVDSEGETHFSFPMCDTQPTTTSTASKNKVAVVVENYQNQTETGQSGYRVWSDGLIEQWGVVNAPAGQWTAVTLLKPYSNTSYNAQVSARNLISLNSDGTTIAVEPWTDKILVGHSWYGNTPSTLYVSWYTIGY